MSIGSTVYSPKQGMRGSNSKMLMESFWQEPVGGRYEELGFGGRAETVLWGKSGKRDVLASNLEMNL